MSITIESGITVGAGVGITSPPASDTALTAEQITQNYNADRSRFGL